MSDWRDVMAARGDASAAAATAEELKEAAPATATGEALLALRLELRALSVLIDFARGDAR